MSTIDALFTLEQSNLEFLFLGECSIQQQEENLAGIRKINFEIGLRKNGTILGMLGLILEQDHSFEKIKTYFKDVFNLIGQDQKTGLPIIMERCFIWNWEDSSNSNEISCVFLALDVVLGKHNLTNNISGTMKFHFGLTNVFRIKKIDFPGGIFKFKRNVKPHAIPSP